MPADRISELRRLMAEGTQGPWDEDDDGWIGAGPQFVAVMAPGLRVQEDRALVIAAVNSLPLLLDAVEAAREMDAILFMPEEEYADDDPARVLHNALARLAGGR